MSDTCSCRIAGAYRCDSRGGGSKRTRAYAPARDASVASIQGLHRDGTFAPVVCEPVATQPAPPGGPCATDAQCNPGQSCFQHVCKSI